MVEMTYREAIAYAIASEMRRDPEVFLIGEDVAVAGGVFKTTPGLLEEFGVNRVRDTPISEEAIIGVAMGAAAVGMRPIAEIMFSDFLATCWDMIANQVAKTTYMSNNSLSLPLVIRTGTGGGINFGAQHSQSLENWAMAVPGLKVVAPSTPGDVLSLLTSAIRDPDPVIFFEHKALYGIKESVSLEIVPEELGSARVVRSGKDVTVVALGRMVHVATEAAERLGGEGIQAEVIDLRSLIPLDFSTVATSLVKTGRLVTVEENPRACGWGAELVSLAAERIDTGHRLVVRRVTTPHVPVPSAAVMERFLLPDAGKVVDAVQTLLL